MTARAGSAALAPPAAPDVERELDLVVQRRDEVADGVLAITLGAADGEPLPPWTPGAHTDVDPGGGLVRQYSLCGDPGDLRTWRIAVLREAAGRGGSERVHALRVGERLRARGPRNHFALRPAPRYVFIAGGIGITPILPMIDAAERQGADWTLHYGGRGRATMAFAADLAAAHGERVEIRSEADRGPLELGTILGRPLPDTLVYCCGPEGLLTAVGECCAAWPPGSLHVERFSARPPADDAVDTSFEVECRTSGVTVAVAPGQSVLGALEAAGGVIVASSCREGVCGTCETTVLSGTPDHRDSVLDDDERAAGDVMMICVSRARSARLVLDL